MKKVWGDIGWVVELSPKEYAVDVLGWRISHLTDEGHYATTNDGDIPTPKNALINGAIKWDGCSNLNIADTDCMLHFCKRDDLVNVGVVLGRLFDEAMSAMPLHAQYKGQSWPETPL